MRRVEIEAQGSKAIAEMLEQHHESYHRLVEFVNEQAELIHQLTHRLDGTACVDTDSTPVEPAELSDEPFDGKVS